MGMEYFQLDHIALNLIYSKTRMNLSKTNLKLIIICFISFNINDLNTGEMRLFPPSTKTEHGISVELREFPLYSIFFYNLGRSHHRNTAFSSLRRLAGIFRLIFNNDHKCFFGNS